MGAEQLFEGGLAELHTHLGGSVASDIMWSLAHEQGIALPTRDYWEFDRLVTVSDPRGVPDLDALDHIYHLTELIQSLKSFLASRLFTGTNVYGRQYSIEDLLAIFLRDLREIAEQKFGRFEGTIIVGRPVRDRSADALHLRRVARFSRPRMDGSRAARQHPPRPPGA